MLLAAPAAASPRGLFIVLSRPAGVNAPGRLLRESMKAGWQVVGGQNPALREMTRRHAAGMFAAYVSRVAQTPGQPADARR